MNPLRAAWERGEVIEWRVRGSENPWMLEPSEWDEQLYEYREYHPLPMPELTLSEAKQAAVDLAQTLVEKRRATDQAALDREVFRPAAAPKRRVGEVLLVAGGALAVAVWVGLCIWSWIELIRWAANGP